MFAKWGPVEGWSNKMARRLDQETKSLEIIVEKCPDRCDVTKNGIRCILRASHEQTEPHRFPAESQPMQRLQDNESIFEGRASERIEMSPELLIRWLGLSVDASDQPDHD